ncbi:CDP-diacylglycerol--glycerol-3-phosphate 3-phosphatidyltransferase [Agrococcus sp. Marseille-Q4369]|uniref:CDP-diacylglycerol--glycerol-3-phosphate 3-phosphatidyltransferase n=1 Tax=Agrococcus sp. Marseille-Q4369 TaxID=2810513 RepID=UPI001B8A8F70|nr:CDP-diacylglycerol--glycerol-3-phosphate 3-phosphatidyltransferase [Agrococcus sp. Marseille-Q4369]QUW19561.1 CDP-diacylglycerol--glycerol-3-phosphate 3-phosphatidyltransferase [Agrococcus sp. Marseille-Q4369]
MAILSPWRGRVWRRGDEPASVASVPNLISVVRILLTPVFVVVALSNPEPGLVRTLAAVLFAVLIATDFVDGRIARDRGLVTDFGKLIDPIADKAITSSALVVLSVLGELPWWITIVVLVREWGITLYRLIVSSRTVIAADWAGKAKTMAQGIALPLALLPLQAWVGEWGVWACVVTMTIAVALTIYSGLEFVWHAWRSS